MLTLGAAKASHSARGDASSLHGSTLILVHDDKPCNKSIAPECGEVPTSARPCLTEFGWVLKFVQPAIEPQQE
jgi:hypothetical protein